MDFFWRFSVKYENPLLFVIIQKLANCGLNDKFSHFRPRLAVFVMHRAGPFSRALFKAHSALGKNFLSFQAFNNIAEAGSQLFSGEIKPAVGPFQGTNQIFLTQLLQYFGNECLRGTALFRNFLHTHFSVVFTRMGDVNHRPDCVFGRL